MRRSAATAAAALLVATMAGCGTGDGSPAKGEGRPDYGSLIATNGSLTKTEFVSHVNRLCRRKWHFILNAVRETRVIWNKEHPHVDTLANFIRSVRLSYFASIGFLIFDWVRRLGAPPGEKKPIEAMIVTMQETVERGQREAPFANVAELKALFIGYNQMARAYGLNRCLVAGGHVPHVETWASDR